MAPAVKLADPTKPKTFGPHRETKKSEKQLATQRAGGSKVQPSRRWETRLLLDKCTALGLAQQDTPDWWPQIFIVLRQRPPLR